MYRDRAVTWMGDWGGHRHTLLVRIIYITVIYIQSTDCFHSGHTPTTSRRVSMHVTGAASTIRCTEEGHAVVVHNERFHEAHRDQYDIFSRHFRSSDRRFEVNHFVTNHSPYVWYWADGGCDSQTVNHDRPSKTST